jgi:hypothetical protein
MTHPFVLALLSFGGRSRTERLSKPYAYVTTGGIELRMVLILPPVCKKNIVPRS